MKQLIDFLDHYLMLTHIFVVDLDAHSLVNNSFNRCLINIVLLMFCRCSFDEREIEREKTAFTIDNVIAIFELRMQAVEVLIDHLLFWGLFESCTFLVACNVDCVLNEKKNKISS